jgi:hypothetical protein
VKRDLEFWQRCTIEQYGETEVTVVLDNLDELTVAPDHVETFQLETGDLVFVQHWPGSISGFPGFVVSVAGEVVDVEFPEALYGETTRRKHFLRDIRFYDEWTLVDWKKGDSVFAYKAIQFYPPLFLLFPATVERIQFEVCVQVEFGDGEHAHVPSTLIEPLDVKVGDFVHTCTSFLRHGTNPDERWSPCRAVHRAGDNLLLQDGTGGRFESHLSMVAVLPKGYRMVDGKFEKGPIDFLPDTAVPKSEPAAPYEVYILRTESWKDAANDPITKAHVDKLVASDPELAWAAGEWFDMRLDERSKPRPVAILWKGQPDFAWNGAGIQCTRPNEEQLAKMIDMAVELDANVIGDDGREYH